MTVWTRQQEICFLSKPCCRTLLSHRPCCCRCSHINSCPKYNAVRGHRTGSKNWSEINPQRKGIAKSANTSSTSNRKKSSPCTICNLIQSNGATYPKQNETENELEQNDAECLKQRRARSLSPIFFASPKKLA